MVSFNPTLTAALVALYISSAVALPNPDPGRFDRPGNRFRPPFNNNNQNQNTNTNINTNVNNNANSNFGGRYGGRYGGYGRFGGFRRPPVAALDKREFTSDNGIDHAVPGVTLAGYTAAPQDDDSDDDDGALTLGGVDTDQDYIDQEDLQKRGIVYRYGYPRRYGRYGVYRYGFPPADQQIQDDYQDEAADVQDLADQDSADQDLQDAQDNAADSQDKLDKRDFFYRYGPPRRYGFPPADTEDVQQDQDLDEQQDQDQEQTGGLQKRRRFRYRYGYPRRFGRFGAYRFPPADLQKRDNGVDDDGQQQDYDYDLQDDQEDGHDLDKRVFFFRYGYPRRFGRVGRVGRFGAYRVYGFPPATEAQGQKQD